MAAMTVGRGTQVLGPEDFQSIHEAVMETPRGRWFLTEFEARLRKSDTATLLDSMKRLESAVAHNHDAIMERLASALASGPEAKPASQTPQELAPKHMKYFKQDEEIFEPAPQARIAAVPEAPKPAPEPKPTVPKGAKLIIRRTGEAQAEAAAPIEAPTTESPAPEADEPAQVAETVIEQAAPVAAAEPEVVVSAQPVAPEADATDTGPKRRIVIIRHKPGEEIEVPLQNEMAEAS